MSKSFRSLRHYGLGCALLTCMLTLMGGSSALAQTTLTDTPLYSTSNVPANLMMALSVEFPTGNVAAYTDSTLPLVYTNSTGAPQTITCGGQKTLTWVAKVSSGTNQTAGLTANYGICYFSAMKYLGYFDNAKCYDYDNTNNYFTPVNATGPTCSGHWSGNMLNWATMTALDEFRQALTGGNRSTDDDIPDNSDDTTVLERARHTNQGSGGNFPYKHLDATDNVAPSTVVGDSTFSSDSDVYISATGVAIQETQTLNKKVPTGQYPYAIVSSELSNTTPTPPDLGVFMLVSDNKTFCQNIPAIGTAGTTNSTSSVGTCKQYYVRVQACKSGMLESNCNSAHAATDYPGAHQYNKPEGLIQQNYTKIRVGASGYVYLSGSGQANGAVRALLHDNGPTAYNGFGGRPANPNQEWDATTGKFVANPDKSTDSSMATAPGGGAFTQSGAINYLNQFGYTNQYETYDTIADLYWATLAYYMQVKLDTSYFSSTNATMDNSFPVFTGIPAPAASSGTPAAYTATVDDPIKFSCQANSIVTIGDAHTHYDTQIPGSTLSSVSGAGLAQIAANGTVPQLNVSTATTALGNLPLIERTTPVTENMATYVGTGAATGLGNAVWGDVATYYIAGLAYYAHTSDIRNDVVLSTPTARSEATLGTQTVTTYAVDVLEPGSYDGTGSNYFYGPAAASPNASNQGPNIYWLAAKYGGFNDIKGDHKPDNELTWHTNSSTGTSLRPDNYFPGNRPDLLQSGLQQIFNNVGATSQSASAPAVTATRALTYVPASITTGPYYSPVVGFPIYTSLYTPVTWTGDVSGYVATAVAGGSVTQVSGSATWDAQIQLDTLTQNVSGTNLGWNTGRRIITWNGTAGVPFRYTKLSPAEQTAVSLVSTDASATGTQFVNYMRGDQSNEGTMFRTRTHILGDIVNSQAVLVQNALSPSYTESANLGYTAFATSVQNRKPMVYVGANDGMLHAFEGDFTATTTNPLAGGGGSELFAYVPSLLYAGPTSTPLINGLPALANINGISTNNYSHHFYVDQTPQVADVDFTLTGNGTTTPTTTASSSKWHTILVGGLGHGGMGIYALDITTVPAALDGTSSATVEAAMTPTAPTPGNKVLWEFTNSDMGYSYGTPLIVKTRKYGWVVLMTTGYNNASGIGRLYVLNAQTGALLQTISTTAGTTTSPAGLTQATAYTQNVADGTIEQVYAGDLLGNVWRFDLSEPALDATGAQTPAYPAPTKLATLTDSAGNPQPITTAPRIELSTDSTGLGTLRWVFVGTGQFLALSDLSNTQQQTMYALRDGTGAAPSTTGVTLTRSMLTANTNLLTGLTSLTDSSLGWYYDLTGTAGTNGGTERIVINPNAAAGVFVIAWTTLTPSSNPCDLLGSIYATTFAGQSVLLGSANTLMPYITTTTAPTGASVVQLPGGTFSILYGQTGGLPQTANMQQTTSTPQLQRVNWREILN